MRAYFLQVIGLILIFLPFVGTPSPNTHPLFEFITLGVGVLSVGFGLIAEKIEKNKP